MQGALHGGAGKGFAVPGELRAPPRGSMGCSCLDSKPFFWEGPLSGGWLWPMAGCHHLTVPVGG